jgi:hypothetical protein
MSIFTANRAQARVIPHRFLLLLCLGGGIGVFVSLALYVTKTAYVALLPFGLALVLSSAFVKDFRLYWFAIFLLSLQFLISKNLNDGVAVLNALNIDYNVYNFTFQITATDLVLLVLLAIWANDVIFHAKPVRFPPITWLAVGYLGISLWSIVGAKSAYLGFVEIWQQIKYFIVYLFAVNCLDTKSVGRVLAAVGVVILVTQAGTTALRYETGNLSPLTFGETDLADKLPRNAVLAPDLSKAAQELAMDRSADQPTVRAFGTLQSPGTTVKLCMMVLPFALFLCVRNAMFRMQVLFAALTCFALLGLILTFARVYYIAATVVCVLAFLLMIRDRMLKREAVVLIVVLALAVIVAISPKIYEQFTIREDSVSVRLLQYEATAKMIWDHPLLGVGLNNGTGEKQNYVNVTYNPNDWDTHFYLEPTHNLYLSLASEIGVFGALLFVAFFGRVTYVTWRYSRHCADPELRLVANALVVAFFGIAVISMMDPLAEYPILVLLWLYAGISLNLPKMTGTPAFACDMNKV